MKSFKEYITEVANTDGADVNEILYGYYMVGSWNKFEDAAGAKKQLAAKQAKISPEEYSDQDGRAKAMADVTFKWMKANGYTTPKRAYWTARPGVLSKAVGVEVDSRKNPTDVLVIDTNDYPLGLSAKSTKGKGDIGFKNPGIGTVEKSLNIRLKDVHDKALNDLNKKYKLPAATAARKKFVRDNPDIREHTIAAGVKVLSGIRDVLMKKLKSMSQDALRDYLFSDWMDAGEVYPPYIKVTGNGKNGNYTASITDPLKNSKSSALASSKITLVNVGNESIGVKAGTKQIMKMRVKFESEKMASSIKFSGDPW